jgi:cell filamentation protein
VSGGDPYVYPGSNVLINRLGITDQARLDYVERETVAQRMAEAIPSGGFDLGHLRAIHRHLFQDAYDWTGELRTVEINKGGSQFQFRQFIETGMADVHRRLEEAGFLRHLSGRQFASAAGAIMGDVNYVHPFREGNGRTQLQYLGLLAEQAGHPIDLARLDPRRWIAASRSAPPTDATGAAERAEPHFRACGLVIGSRLLSVRLDATPPQSCSN